MFHYLEALLRILIVFITNYLPVKVIRDNGVPFLYRYHLFSFSKDGPGLCIHHFVKSDPDRGYHDHPWTFGLSFILAGRYDERVLTEDRKGFHEYRRNRWRFNYLDGTKTFHRVMIDEGGDAWTLFFFWKRTKTWSMVSLTGQLKAISTSIMDLDGGWWTKAMKGIGLHSHLDHPGKVIATVDCVVLHEDRVLLIKRGKTPFKEMWALPGGRIEQRDTDVLSAAYRELKEETNIDGTSVNLKYFRTIGNNTRDPRGFALTNVFVAKVDTVPEGIRAGDDAVDHKWFPINALPDVAFDHRDIISAVNATSITYQCGPVERID